MAAQGPALDSGRGWISVKTRFVEDMTGFASLEPFWNRLVGESATNTCHSTFEWLFTWWKHFSAGRRLLLVVAYEGDQPVGIAPLYVGDGVAEPRDLHFIGQGLSDYADFITPHDKPDITDALVSALLLRRSSWTGVDLEEIPSGSPNRVQLERLIDEGDATASWVPTVLCPYLPVSGGWDEFYQTRGEGFRHNLQNKLNRSERNGVELRYVDRRHVDDDTFVDEVTSLSDRRNRVDGHRSPFLNHPDQEFLREVLPIMGERDQLRVAELRSKGALVAFALAFHWQGVVYDWNTQYDPRFDQYSLGRIALKYLAQQTFQDGCHELDFMRGEEPYKFQWTALTRANLAMRSSKTSESLRAATTTLEQQPSETDA
jgi:CelD/BcsL family acetyltransferase involved in cellulose biosynthesis